MSLTRDRGYIVFECDQCKEPHETGTIKLDIAVQRIKALGWFIRPDRGVWLHYCGMDCFKLWQKREKPVVVNDRQYWQDRD